MLKAFASVLTAAAVSVCFGSVAQAVEIFPNQPRVSAAYNKVSGAISDLEKAARERGGGHVNNAFTKLGEAKTQLEMTTKNKGSAPASAIKLIDQARQNLAATPATKASINSAATLAKEALKKIVHAGNAGK